MLLLPCFSSATICRSCCDPGTLPQSVLHRYSRYLWQRYQDIPQHISHCDLDFQFACRNGLSGLLMSHALLMHACACVCWQVLMQTCSQYFLPSRGTPPWNTFMWARTSTSKTGAASAPCHAVLQLFMGVLCEGICIRVCRVLDEVLQKLVQLIQEEECVSDKKKRSLAHKNTLQRSHIMRFLTFKGSALS